MTNCHSCGDVYKHSDPSQRKRCEAWYDSVLAGGTPLGLRPSARRAGGSDTAQACCSFIFVCGMAAADPAMATWAKVVTFALACAFGVIVTREVER